MHIAFTRRLLKRLTILIDVDVYIQTNPGRYEGSDARPFHQGAAFFRTQHSSPTIFDFDTQETLPRCKLENDKRVFGRVYHCCAATGFAYRRRSLSCLSSITSTNTYCSLLHHDDSKEPLDYHLQTRTAQEDESDSPFPRLRCQGM